MSAPNLSSYTNVQNISKAVSQYILDNLDVSYAKYDTEQERIDRALDDGARGALDFINERIHPDTSIDDISLSVPPAPGVDNLNVDFAATIEQVKRVVDDLQGSWLMDYFPASLPDGVDPLLTQVLSGTLITETMQELFWSRAKYQAQRDAARYEDEAISTWASRGFAMPGGVINKQIARKNQELFNMNGELAAQQAIKGLEIQIDAVKFSADISTKLRLGLIDAMTGLVSVYASLPATAANYAASLSAAKRDAYAAIQEYYKMLITNSQLRLDVEKFNISNNLEYAKVQADFIVKYINESINAANAAMQSVTSQAAAQINGLGNVSSIGIQTAA